MDVYRLAQSSEGGYESAMQVIGKLIKKISDREDFHNVSGFVHKSCKNASDYLGRYRHTSWAGAKKTRRT
jgi:hypothetical protein